VDPLPRGGGGGPRRRRRPGRRGPAHVAAGLDIVVAPPEPEDDSPAELARRLAGRAEELLRAGQRPAAEVILRRALAFAPDDARILALLEAHAKPPAGGEER
jgi:hypothetical protein